VTSLIQSIVDDTLDPTTRFDELIAEFSDEELTRLCSFFRDRWDSGARPRSGSARWTGALAW
ncbi:MAG TPA: hypothetical protein VFL57_04700, partial [Bryobacteraceae bacterium]|nr:hypothetical protein [Bryobacteraceae bacterium]